MSWPTLKTYLAPTTRSLLQHLKESPAFPPTSVNVFALSAQAYYLQSAVSYLNRLPNSIGVLSTSLSQGVQLSVASYSNSVCLPFRSTIPGVPQPEVGRIRMYRPPTKEDRASEARLEDVLSGGTMSWNDALSKSGSFELPPELEKIGNKSSVSSFFYLSDNAPEGLMQSLHRHFPNAGQLGLIASSTPFITGRPFTLFKRSKIFADGAVGLALFHQGKQEHDIVFENLEAFSPILEVTQAQTNMVETLDHGNSVEALLQALHQRGPINKEDDIYLGVISDATSPVYRRRTRRPPFSHVFKVTAGGPTKGTLLLDATEGPRVGSKVQFVVATKPEPPSTFPLIGQPTPTISLSAISDSDIGTVSSGSQVKEVENVFLGTSENGFVVGSSTATATHQPWLCTIPGAKYQVQWQK
ncbi:hypothetical protein RhiJN_18209 [Ceratobasidium sp. AG-Ba]|nr:hypothetical protein RhiJN_18209 [Ceratobasidium sp. AG-Ba]